MTGKGFLMTAKGVTHLRELTDVEMASVAVAS